MERIKLKLNNKFENKILKFRGRRIKVKPYISTQDMLGITSVVLQQFDSSIDKYKEMPLIKTIYDILVIHCCTNVELDGISFDNDEIKLELNSEKVGLIEASGLIENLIPHIYNYGTWLRFLIKTLEMRNQYESFAAFGNALPDGDKLGDAIIKSLEALKDAKEKDPETFEKIVRETATKKVREKAQKETKSKKKNGLQK